MSAPLAFLLCYLALAVVFLFQWKNAKAPHANGAGWLALFFAIVGIIGYVAGKYMGAA